MGLGLLCMGCYVWVCCVWFLEKIQRFGFAVYGLPGEERWLDKEGIVGLGLMWLNGLSS
ncbi:hypothetical protein NC651_017561 [Populus alba x Populus x berolinensis]|nr:hypothetical protein NC651_017561 [Populus alba x Populus x berolinensis]